MLISLGFTAAESVVVSFNQKTQYDSIWQSLRPHLNATVGARELILIFFDELEQSHSRWQCCSSAVLLRVSWPLPRPNVD